MSGTRGGTIKVAVPHPPPHQDIHKSVSPIIAGWGPGIAYSRIFRYQWISPDAPKHGSDGLETRYDPLESASAREIVCDLCESWQLDDDGNLSVKLRSDLHWHISNPFLDRGLNAEDVVYSINRLSDPTMPNSYLTNTLSEAISTAPDMVQISLTLPDAEIFHKLADARFAIVASETVNLNGDLTQGPTIGTGPWMLDTFSTDRMRFVANHNYFIPELPLLDGIEVVVIEDAKVRMTSLRTRQIDLLQPELNELIPSLERFPELQWTRSHDPSVGIEVAFNTNHGVLAAPSMRTAIMKAWNPNFLIDTLHHGQSFISVGLPLNDPEWLLPTAEVDAFFADRTGVLELLESHDIPQDSSIRIRVGEFGDAYIATATSLASAISSIGIDASVERVSTRTFGEDVWGAGDYEAYVGAPPPQSSATSMLFTVHHSAGPWNTTGYANPFLDSLIEQQTIELKPANRRELMLEIQREILRGAYLFRPGVKVLHWVWWPRLNNVTPNTFRADSFWLTRLWLDANER